MQNFEGEGMFPLEIMSLILSLIPPDWHTNYGEKQGQLLTLMKCFALLVD